MKNNYRRFLTEILWIVFAAVLTFLLAYLALSWTFKTGEVDLKLFDTYFFVPGRLILMPLFCLLAFLMYFFKEHHHQFGRRLPSWILVISGVALALTLTVLIRYFGKNTGMPVGGWVSYGPITTLSVRHPSTETPPAKIVADFLTALQAMILLLLLYGTYRIGQKSKSRKE